MQAPFTVYLNEVEKGMFVVLLRGEDVYMFTADLEFMDVRGLHGRELAYDGYMLVELKSLAPALTYVLDDRQIALRLTVNPELLPKVTIDATGRPTGAAYETRTGGYMNYAVHATDGQQLDLYQETGVSVSGNFLFNSMYVSTAHETVRGMTSYTLNERSSFQRLAFGDSLVQTGVLGTGAFVGGLTLQRTYDFDPYLVTSPRLGFQGTAATPTTLQVYVNNSLVRTERIAPGSFDLRNLQVGGGAGTATYVLKDIFGQEQRVDMPFYISGNVLRKGFSEYTYSLGSLRRNVAEASWDYGGMALLALHRYGITDRITVMGRGEAADHFVSAGGGLTFLPAVGPIELQFSASDQQNVGTGWAGMASYGYQSRVFTSSFRARRFSQNYATLGVDPTADHLKNDLLGVVSVPIQRRFSVSANGSYVSMQSGAMGWSSGTSFSGRVSGGLMASGSFVVARSAPLPLTWSVIFGISVSFGRNTASTQTRVGQGGAAVLLGANRSLPMFGPGYGYRFSGIFDRSAQADVGARYQTSFGRYQADYYHTSGQLGASDTWTADASGALAIVPRVGLFPTLPIYDSFGLIRLPGLQGVHGYSNGQEVGTTDRLGNLVTPNVLSYYGNRFGVFAGDVPLNVTLDTLEKISAPPLGGAAVAEFQVSRPHFFRGKAVMINADKRVIPKYGEIRVHVGDKDIASPLNDEGAFELEGLHTGPQSATVVSEHGMCDLKLDIPDKPDLIIDLGEITCELR